MGGRRSDGRSAKDQLRPVRHSKEGRRRSLEYKVNDKIRDLLTYDHIKFMLGQGGRKNFEFLKANEEGVVTQLGQCLLDKDEKNPDEKKYYEGIIRKAYDDLEQEGILYSHDTKEMLPESLQELLSRDEIEAKEAEKATAEQERLAGRGRRCMRLHQLLPKALDAMFGSDSDSD